MGSIPLINALRMTPNADADELSLSWIDWKLKYPEDVNTLSPVYVAALDALAGIVAAVHAIDTIIRNMKITKTTATTTFKTAQLAIPGLGSASAALDAIGLAVDALITQLGSLIVTLGQNAIKILKLLVNINVREDATL